MSKKYVYFKCNALVPHPFSRDTFVKLELEDPAEDLRPVQTIFQLMDHPDLKLIISKEETLQRRLASGLPQKGMHGFLWTGERLPALLEQILFRSMLIERVFIFQRNTDPAPALINPSQPHLEIYNWWIFEYNSFFSIYCHALSVRQRNASEVEIDKALAESKTDYDAIGPIQLKTGHKTILLESRPAEFIWVQTLLSTLPQPISLFSMSQFVDGFTALSSTELTFFEQDPERQWRFKALGLVKDLDLPNFQKAVDGISSSLRILLASSDDTQTDLFVDPLDRSFSDLWRTESQRLNSLQPALSAAHQKAFAVVNFLIARKVFGSSIFIENLFKEAVKETVAQIFRKPNNQDFTQLFLKNLRSLYSDLYLLHKLKGQTKIAASDWKISHASVFQEDDQVGTLIFKPQQFVNAKDNKIERQLAHLFEHTNPSDGFDEEQVWHDEIGMQGRMLRRAGRAGKYLFNRLYSQNCKQEALVLFRDWLQTDQFLGNVENGISDDLKLCLVLPGIQVDDKYVSIKDIVLGVLEAQEIYPSLGIENVISSESHQENQAFDILIIKKEKHA